MSEDARKDCRTQGKYSDRSQYYDDRRQDKIQKMSPSLKEPLKKIHKRKSDGGKESDTSLSSDIESPVRYQENSDHSFSQLEDVKRPIEIKDPGKYVLSTTENGESVVFYDPFFFESDEASDFMSRLRNTTSWYEKNIVIRGVEFPQPRLVAWYGPFAYSYSGVTLEPAEMPDCVVEIKTKVEQYLREKGVNVQLNSVLLNLYRDNKDSVSWHSDDEMSMGCLPTIASVSLGETRRFEMRRKIKVHDEESSSVKSDEYFVHLRNGSLITMDGCMQKDWQHRVPKEYHDRYERINLTFRTVYKLEDLPSSPGTYSKNQPIDNTLKKSHKVCKSENKWDRKFTYNKSLSKTHYELNGPNEIDNSISSSHNKTSLKNDDKGNGSEGFADSEFSLCNENLLQTDAKINESNKWASEPSHNKESTLLNNLNGNRKNAKINMQNKSLRVYFSNFFSNNHVNGTANARKNKSFSTEDSHVPTKSPVNNQENAFKVKSEPTSDKTSVVTLNVEATEFIPKNKPAAFCESNPYGPFGLEDLNYNGDVMNCESLKELWLCESNPYYENSPYCGSNPYYENSQYCGSNPYYENSQYCGNNPYYENSPYCGSNPYYENSPYCGSNPYYENSQYCGSNPYYENSPYCWSNPYYENSPYCGSNPYCENNPYGSFGLEDLSYNVDVMNCEALKEFSSCNENFLQVDATSDETSVSTQTLEAEFVPVNKSAALCESNRYGSFGLEDLLHYNVDVMDCESLKDYAVALKNRVLESIYNFRHSEREQLEFLCNITDGKQTDSKQKIITSRILAIIQRAFKSRISPNYEEPYGILMKPNHGN